ncbi:conserved hypothetical protein [Rippkaea orientalis PCC 8801]|uniref:Glycosyltransferase RgtA/B/C/D-like domain-containing protein n=1 Tax=Rippkaea orientalis (strain PCC 8801 / RF-1) TaxID=41431 RepID=B7K3R3_RIPO1|nr:glycosyltransferase family 39 protein [Rippkaea orientalis]ACK66453.1 conserved hypothetical protein [Rippkaea orientalis PCC 8801]
MKISRLSIKLSFDFLIIFLICLSLVLGIFFRFYHLDKKFYSYDETHTSLRVSGYAASEMFSELASKNAAFDLVDFQKYQHPNSDKGTSQIISGLSKEDPHQAPIYFILARFWVQFFNHTLNNVAATRAFSAFLSVLALFLMYLLCQELFNSKKAALIAVALMAISPFHVLYGQYARPYSLFTVMVLLSSFLLLKVLKKKTLFNWILYTLACLFGFYTHIFMSLVIVSHFIYVLFLERFKLTRVFLSFIVSTLVTSTAGLLWLSTAISYNTKSGSIGNFRFWKLSQVIKMHLFRVSKVFVDTHNLGGIVRFESNSLLTTISQLLLVALLLVLIIYSLLYLIQKSDREQWLFVLSLIAVTGLLLGGIVRLIPNQMEARYYIPVYLGIQISIAYLLAQKINQKNNVFAMIFMTLIGLGIISCSISSQAQIWWVNLPSSIIQAPQVVQTVNAAKNPIIVWNDYQDVNGNWNTHVLLGWSYKLNPNVRFVYLNENSNLDQLLEDSNDLLLFKPQEEVQQKLSQKYNLEPAYQGESNPWLWTINLKQAKITN